MTDAAVDYASIPLPTGPVPRLAVGHAQWHAALGRLVAATRQIPSLTIVVGPPGTGKTLLLRTVAERLREDGDDVILLPRGDLPIEPRAPAPPGRHRVVLIDEADRMDAAAVERLRVQGECAIVLTSLAGPGDAAGKPIAAATTIALSSLPPSEVAAFVAGRLAQSGVPPDVFDDAATAELAVQSGGNPRVLDAILSAALFVARGSGADRVGAPHVEQAAAFRNGGYDATSALPIPSAAASSAERAPESAITPAPEAQPEAEAAAPRALVNEAVDAGRPRSFQWRGAGAAAGLALIVVCGWLWSGQQRPHVPSMVAAPLATPQPEAADDQQPAIAPVADIPATAAPAAAPHQQAPAPIDPAPPPAVPDQPARPQQLPIGAPIRVKLRTGQGSAAAAGIAQALSAAGFAVDSQTLAPRDTAASGVTYFFAEDRGAATAVLQAAGLSGTAVMAKPAGAGNLPFPGSIELTVTDPGDASVRRQPSGTHGAQLSEGILQ